MAETVGGGGSTRLPKEDRTPWNNGICTGGKKRMHMEGLLHISMSGIRICTRPDPNTFSSHAREHTIITHNQYNKKKTKNIQEHNKNTKIRIRQINMIIIRRTERHMHISNDIH